MVSLGETANCGYLRVLPLPGLAPVVTLVTRLVAWRSGSLS
jgi:hypothetical protein